MLLLVASCYFYMCFIPVFILILASIIVIDYFAGIQIAKSEGKKRKLFLIISLTANIGILVFFKYYLFLNDIITSLLQSIGFSNPIPYLSIILPIGLSFHTFQAMSYTIEVYRGNQTPEKHFGIYALYVMFYPQLVAGPIERPQNLLHQFRKQHSFDYNRVTAGLKLMLWGFFKKVVIADRIALLVNPVYDNPTQYEGLPLIISTVLFSFQIFCDFSGYSDIAIGAAKVMGFDLMTNFNRPYFSKNLTEFWTRWHISLSTWFKDYLYIPLGGNRVAVPRWYLNLMIVFLISGLWHGANWTFIIWGAMHALFLILSLITKNGVIQFFKITRIDNFPFIKKTIQVSVTFSIVSIAWIFFRAKNIDDAFYIITHLFKNVWLQLHDIVNNVGMARSNYLFMNLNKFYLYIALISVLLMELMHFIERKKSIITIVSEKPKSFRWIIYYITLALILIFGVFEQSSQFIYFQF